MQNSQLNVFGGLMGRSDILRTLLGPDDATEIVHMLSVGESPETVGRMPVVITGYDRNGSKLKLSIRGYVPRDHQNQDFTPIQFFSGSYNFGVDVEIPGRIEFSSERPDTIEFF